MADPVNGAAAAEEELVDYEEEEVLEGEAAKGDQVRIWAGAKRSIGELHQRGCRPTGCAETTYFVQCINFLLFALLQVKKGYVGIHSSGFKDFLLKPELLRAIQDCGFEHPSEGKQNMCILVI